MEALCWAITAQLIQSSRAPDPAADRPPLGPTFLPADHPPDARPGSVAASRRPVRRRDRRRAPAELESMDLSHGRSIAMVHCARGGAGGPTSATRRRPAPARDPEIG
jgi:hypothetical protein